MRLIWVLFPLLFLLVSACYAENAGLAIQLNGVLFYRGDHVVASVRLSSTMPANQVIKISWISTDGNVVKQEELLTNIEGLVSSELIVPSDAISGYWKVAATSDNTYAEAYFRVQSVPTYLLTVGFEGVDGKPSVYVDGNLLGQGNVTVEVSRGNHTVSVAFNVNNYYFKEWDDGVVLNERTVNVEKQIILVATYEKQVSTINYGLIVPIVIVFIAVAALMGIYYLHQEGYF